LLLSLTIRSKLIRHILVICIVRIRKCAPSLDTTQAA